MSRIYRSRDLPAIAEQVAEVDLRAQQMGPMYPDRPVGGFAGYQGSEEQRPMTQIERQRREAERMVEEARRQAETIQRDAYHAGFEQGEKAGMKLASQKIEPAAQAFNQLIEHLTHERENLIKHHERELIKVAFAIAGQVVKTMVDEDSELVGRVVQSALEKVVGSQNVTLHVSPHDKELIELYITSDTGFEWSMDHLTIEGDETVGRGGCRVETEHGDIDATIETQLRVLKNQLWSE